MKIQQTTFIIFVLLVVITNSHSQDFKENERIKSLINKFNDNDPWINGEAINKLAEIGEPAVNDLIISLQDSNDNVRWCAAITLEKISPFGRQAIPVLTKALQDESANVRWCSALALSKYKSEAVRSVSSLQKLLYDKDNDVRWSAYIALSNIDKESLNVIPNLDEKIKVIEKVTPELMKELKVPGVSIALIKNKKIAYSKSFGVVDVNTNQAVNDTTMFEACSMSKPVFALLVMKLVEQSKIDLDKPLTEYLSEKFVCEDEEYTKQITARMILSHTSGLPNWRKGDEE